jgi:hypothetical protein
LLVGGLSAAADEWIDRNTFTFNLDWTAEREALKEFTDVRDIQKSVKAKGFTLASEADESTTGPA